MELRFSSISGWITLIALEEPEDFADAAKAMQTFVRVLLLY